MVVLDPRALEVTSRWPLAPCEDPSGMAIDQQHRRLFVGCGNKLMAVINADTGKVVTTLPIGRAWTRTPWIRARSWRSARMGKER